MSVRASLKAPTNVVITNITAMQFTMTWDPVDDATAYDIYCDGRYIASTFRCTWTAPARKRGTYMMQVAATGNRQYSHLSKATRATLAGVVPWLGTSAEAGTIPGPR